jgi:Ca2+-binding EF-hand superfamily protein
MNHDVDLRLTAQQALEHEWFRSESAFVMSSSLGRKSDQLAQTLLTNLLAWEEKSAFLRWTIVAMARQLSADCEARQVADLAYQMFSDASNTLTCEQLANSLAKARLENASVSSKDSAKKRFKNRIKEVKHAFRNVLSGLPRSEHQQSHGGVHAELKSLVSTVDAENKGIVDYTLLVAAMLPRDFYCDDDRISEAFKLFDIRGCGRIRPQDLRTALKCRDFPGRFSQMVHDCDLDGDGCINLADFSAMVHGHSCRSKC